MPHFQYCCHLDGQGGFFENVNMATQSSEISLSSYVQSMGASAKTRYLSKIECIEEDPYLLNKSALDENMKHLPNIDYTDIVNYLVYSTSYLTAKEKMLAVLVKIRSKRNSLTRLVCVVLDQLFCQ